MKFFRQVKDSFLNFNAYREFAFQKAGTTFKYILLLFTLIFVVEGIKFAFVFDSETGEIINSIKEKTPEFSLRNGELTVEGPQPMVFDDENGTALIIDTTGQTDESVLDEYNEGAFISKDKVVTKQNLQLRTIEFGDFRELTFDKEKLVSYLPMFKWVLPVIGFFAYFLKLVWVLMTTVVLAVIGLLINSSQKGRLAFGNVWNSAVYAFTLPWLMEMVVYLAYPAMPGFGLAKWGVALYILYRGIQAANQPILTDDPPPNDIIV